jgi:arylsulfatase A-like enzyme
MIPRRRMATVRFVMKAPMSEGWAWAGFDSSRRTGLVLAAACAVVLIGCGESPPDSPRPIRKIVLISLDTLRADHLGVYGYPRETSPEIDGFARQGFVFDRMLAPAPNTPPSQMSMMTSLYPGRHGFTGNGDKLVSGIETLAERLREAGLRTAGFVDGGYLHAAFGFDRGFDTYDYQGGGLAEILPRAMGWLDEHDDEPFFLFVHTYDIHAPYFSPAPYDGMFHEQAYSGDLIPTVERLDSIFQKQEELDPEDLQHLVDSYDEGIRYTDYQIGRLLDDLERRGNFEDTLIIITSDHGEEFGEHGSVIHWQLYFQPNLRIPLIVRPPGGTEGPLRIADPAELIDILPTLLALVGAEPFEAAQGRSLVSAMSARQDGGGVQGLPESDDHGIDRLALGWWPDPEQLPLRSVVQGDYQLIFNTFAAGRDELYDLAADPMTQHNLAREKPELAARLRELGLQGMRENRPIEMEGDASELRLDPEIHDQLRALGYER